MLRYETSGDVGPWLVLIPEVGMGVDNWDEVLPLIATGRRILRYDPRGAGLSQKIVGSVSYADHVADLKGLLKAAGLAESVVLIGAAMGGGIALQFAADNREQVRAVIALSPATGVSAAARPNMLADADKLENIGVRAWVDYQQPDVYPESIRSNAARLEHWRALQLANDAHSWAANTRMIANADFSGVFDKVRCPTLFVASAFYPPRPPERVKQVADQVKDSKFAIIQTGHFMPVQGPELLAPIINDFLRPLGW
jgi:pimeloyl-ACP methyl ester carboxylesterase